MSRCCGPAHLRHLNCVPSTLPISRMTLDVEYLLLKYCSFPISYIWADRGLDNSLPVLFSFWLQGLITSNLEREWQKLVDKLSTRIICDSRILSPSERFLAYWALLFGVQRLIDAPGHVPRSRETNFYHTITLVLPRYCRIPRNDACL
jgi:hypothetical protein